jgi:hypothetical protein
METVKIKFEIVKRLIFGSRVKLQVECLALFIDEIRILMIEMKSLFSKAVLLNTATAGSN